VLLLLLVKPTRASFALRPTSSCAAARNTRGSKSPPATGAAASSSSPHTRIRSKPGQQQPAAQRRAAPTARGGASATCQAVMVPIGAGSDCDCGGDGDGAAASSTVRADGGGGSPGPSLLSGPSRARAVEGGEGESPCRPSPRRRLYRRTLLPVPDRALQPNHAVFGALMGPSRSDAIVSYQVYQLSPIAVDNNEDKTTVRSNDEALVTIDGGGGDHLALVEAIVQFGRGVDGHPGVVHGGVLALVVDDVLGFAYGVADPSIEVAVTANLNINYRLPVSSGSHVAIRAFLLEQTGRKLVFSCLVVGDDEPHDANGQLQQDRAAAAPVVYCDATSVYVIPRTKGSASTTCRSGSNL
jgi:acyl-coenzyme A thioesterase PaaI-like protein